MATVIQYDIRNAELIEHALQEIEVRLASDADSNLIFFEVAAFWVDVDADYLRMWTEVTLPQLSRTATSATDF